MEDDGQARNHIDMNLFEPDIGKKRKEKKRDQIKEQPFPDIGKIRISLEKLTDLAKSFE